MKEIINNLRSDEKIVAIIRRYLISFFKDFMIAILFIDLPLISLYFILKIENNEVFFNFSMVSFVFCLIFGIIWMIRTIFIWKKDCLVVTNQRIFDITQKGFFDRTVSEIDIRDIESMNISKIGLLKTILNFGNLEVKTSNAGNVLLIEDIKDPFDIQQLINDRKQKLTKETSSKFENLTEDKLIGLAYKLKEKLGSERLNNILKD